VPQLTSEHAGSDGTPGAAGGVGQLIVEPIDRIDLGVVSEDFTRLVPLEFARDRLVISQGVDESGVERVAVAGRPEDELVLHNLGVRLGRRCSAVRSSAERIAAALDELAASVTAERTDSEQRHSAEMQTDSTLDESDIRAALEADERDLLSTAGRAPVVRLVNGLLFEALQRRSSDVHVQPSHEAMVVRFRIDGVLVEARSVPRRLLEPIISRIKVMARMDIAERRLPQDGRASVTLGGQEVDLRIASIPTALGERMVIRLLDKRRTELFEFERLGMPLEIRHRFAQVCDRPNGIVLVTGPTGSGKTTTLYAALKRLDSSRLNIMTLEDPIEYELPGVSQSQVSSDGGRLARTSSRKGVTFESGLRHILRQDPDVIMVGEIRDAETARIAIQAALTGHLVFSTLHTNSAAGAVVRLVDLGVEPYLLNASLAGVLAQRLVRTRCLTCGGTSAQNQTPCADCLGTRFRGRIGLFELLVMDDSLRTLVLEGATTHALHSAARRAGMRTLREAGAEAAAVGRTTTDEVDRVILAEDFEDRVQQTPVTDTNELPREA